MQELFDYQIVNNNREVLNMLNVKYIIQSDEKGEPFAVKNPEANGNAWFISKLQKVNSADDEMKALTKLNTKDFAVIQNNQTEIYLDDFTTKPSYKINKFNFVKDSTATIQVVAYKPSNLKYISNNKNDGFAVFSVMYYKNGWTSTIDGKTTTILRVNYTLRGCGKQQRSRTMAFGESAHEYRTSKPQADRVGSAHIRRPRRSSQVCSLDNTSSLGKDREIDRLRNNPNTLKRLNNIEFPPFF